MATNYANHNHIHQVSPNEWEDEAFVELAEDAAYSESSSPKRAKGKPLGQAAAALRSSFTMLSPGSSTDRITNKIAHDKSGTREANQGFVGTLLHGLANAVGFHRDESPMRDESPFVTPTGHSKLLNSHAHGLARLSSAALMRNELQNFSQFGDLRNDSFSSPATTRLRRRSSLLLVPPGGSDTATPRGPILSPASGDLSRHSSSILSSPHPQNSQTATNPQPLTEVAPPPSPSHTHHRATPNTPRGVRPAPSPGVPADLLLSSPRISVCGQPQWPSVTAPSGEPTRLQTPPLHPLPHPPPQTRTPLLPPGTPSSSSTEHLPPVFPPGSGVPTGRPGSSNNGVGAGGGGGVGGGGICDRPPTPGGAPGSSHAPTSNIFRVLSSFHLPELAASSKSVTERRGSVSGGIGAVLGISGGSATSFTRLHIDGSARRARRSSMSATGESLEIMGPGGAAIHASLAKRAAAMAGGGGGAGGLISHDGGGGGGAAAALVPNVTPSGGSLTALSRPGGPPAPPRVPTVSGKSPTATPTGGILQDFHSSLELEEDGALAAVDAEFDRRFGQAAPSVPGAMEVLALHHNPQPPALQQQPPLPPPQEQQQCPPPPPAAAEPHRLADTATAASVAAGPAAGALSVDPMSLWLARGTDTCGSPSQQQQSRRPRAPAEGGPGRSRRRMSCIAAIASGGPGVMPVLGDGGEGSDMASSMSFTSMPPGSNLDGSGGALNPLLDTRMRLASIRLSYAEGIVAGAPGLHPPRSARSFVDVPGPPGPGVGSSVREP